MHPDKCETNLYDMRIKCFSLFCFFLLSSLVFSSLHCSKYKRRSNCIFLFKCSVVCHLAIISIRWTLLGLDGRCWNTLLWQPCKLMFHIFKMCTNNEKTIPKLILLMIITNIRLVKCKIIFFSPDEPWIRFAYSGIYLHLDDVFAHWAQRIFNITNRLWSGSFSWIYEFCYSVRNLCQRFWLSHSLSVLFSSFFCFGWLLLVIAEIPVPFIMHSLHIIQKLYSKCENHLNMYFIFAKTKNNRI